MINSVFYYSKSGEGFFSREINGDAIPGDAVEISADYRAALLAGQSAGKIISCDSKGHPTLKNPPILKPKIPSSVTMRQARLALHAEGLLQSVEDAINEMQEPSKTAARIEWDYAGHVERQSQFVAMIGSAIGLDDAKMDALFMSASAL